MSTRYTKSFKIQAIEKALNRSEVTSVSEVARSLEIVPSTLHTWITQSKAQEFESVNNDETFGLNKMTKEKRPQDWSLEERLKIIISCGSLSEKAVSELCREQGLYPHHLKQWEMDFASGAQPKGQVKNNPDMKNLKQENKELKRELNRKNMALAETAALLVLQKKVNAIWGNDVDNSL